MKRILSMLLLALFLVACSPTARENETIFRYKGSYVGDNSAVSHIITHTNNNDTFSHFELSTTEEPYGITITYTSITPEEMLTTATYLLTLISNAQWVAFELPDETIEISRNELEELFGQNLDFENETLLQEKIASKIVPIP